MLWRTQRAMSTAPMIATPVPEPIPACATTQGPEIHVNVFTMALQIRIYSGAPTFELTRIPLDRIYGRALQRNSLVNPAFSHSHRFLAPGRGCSFCPGRDPVEKTRFLRARGGIHLPPSTRHARLEEAAVAAFRVPG